MKFNFSIKKKTAPTANYEGAEALVMPPQLELYAAIATTLLGNASYESGNARLTRIIKLIDQTDPQFVARLTIYAHKVTTRPWVRVPPRPHTH